MTVCRNLCATNHRKSALKSKRHSQQEEPPILLYRKGKLPSKLRGKKPAKGGLGKFKRNLTIDPYSIQGQDRLKIDTQKTSLMSRLKIDFNNDLVVVSQCNETSSNPSIS